jgi:CheY-like chemotaxis protein
MHARRADARRPAGSGVTVPPGTRVLIVEDETIIAMTAEDMVDMLGGVVAATVTNVRDAVAAVSAVTFDVAMLDINLNGEMSLPVAEALRAAGRPFLFTTGYGSAGVDPDFLGAEVVKKPYLLRDLEAALVRVLGG